MINLCTAASTSEVPEKKRSAMEGKRATSFVWSVVLQLGVAGLLSSLWILLRTGHLGRRIPLATLKDAGRILSRDVKCDGSLKDAIEKMRKSIEGRRSRAVKTYLYLCTTLSLLALLACYKMLDASKASFWTILVECLASSLIATYLTSSIYEGLRQDGDSLSCPESASSLTSHKESTNALKSSG